LYKFFGILVAIFISLLPPYYYLYLKPKPIISSCDTKDINITSNTPSEVKDFKENNQKKIVQKKIICTPTKKTSQKPRLMIIMDDLATIKEAKALKSLPFHVVPSIFPKTISHPNTPKMAKMFKSIMMHLPMEAVSFSKPEINTLLIQDNYKTLKTKINNSLKEFSNIKAINNHTGSKFTATYQPFYNSIKILKNRGIFFIDSKTTTKSEYIKISKKLQQKIFQRDIFLDNILKVSYIKSQLKKAVKIAKAKGFAIAICHPKKETFKALRQSKQLLKNIKLVGIDEL